MIPVKKPAEISEGKGPSADDENAILNEVPGELVSYSVEVGAVLVAGRPLCVLESMKMEIAVTVPIAFDGKRVRRLCGRTRTKTSEGGNLRPGDALVEVQ